MEIRKGDFVMGELLFFRDLERYNFAATVLSELNAFGFKPRY